MRGKRRQSILVIPMNWLLLSRTFVVFAIGKLLKQDHLQQCWGHQTHSQPFLDHIFASSSRGQLNWTGGSWRWLRSRGGWKKSRHGRRWKATRWQGRATTAQGTSRRREGHAHAVGGHFRDEADLGHALFEICTTRVTSADGVCDTSFAVVWVLTSCNASRTSNLKLAAVCIRVVGAADTGVGDGRESTGAWLGL